MACSGCCFVVVWTWGTGCLHSAPALTQCFIGAQPGIRVGAGPWEASQGAKQVTFVISAHRTGHGSFLWHPCDNTEPWRWRCHPNHYRAVFQWLQTQSKAKDTQFCACKWSNYNQRHGDCTFQSAPLAELHRPYRCAWLCIQARRAGRTCWPSLLSEASPSWPTSFVGALLHPAQFFPLWTTEGPKTSQFWEQGIILHKAFKSNLPLFRKACYSNGIPSQAWYSLNVPHWLQMWPSLTLLCAWSSTGTAHCIFNLI